MRGWMTKINGFIGASLLLIVLSLGACQSPKVNLFVNVDRGATFTINDVQFNAPKSIEADVKAPLPLP